jgi:hypothetical protein
MISMQKVKSSSITSQTKPYTLLSFFPMFLIAIKFQCKTLSEEFSAGSGFCNLNPLFGKLNKVMNAFYIKSYVHDKNI